MNDSTTIEVMLSPEQMKALAKDSKVDAMQHLKSRILIGAIIVAVLIVSGGVAHLAAKQKPVPAAVVPLPPPAPLPPPVAAPAEPAAEPVLFKNPFDHNEVFEFPPGTTQAEARDAVAQLLMERAQGRGPDVLKLRIRKVHNSKALSPATATRSGQPGPQGASSAQTASPPADPHRSGTW